VLEKIAAGETFYDTFAILSWIVESLLPGMHAAVFALDEDGKHLNLTISPTFPPDLASVITRWNTTDVPCPPVDAIECREPVIVADVARHYGGHEVARGDSACAHAAWVIPLVGEDGHVLGTFGVYGHMSARPDPSQLKVMESAARLATMALTCRRTEYALGESESKLNQFFENVKDVMFVIAVHPDESFSFHKVNSAFLRATGLREDQIVGKGVEQVIPEPSLSFALGRYRQAIREKRAISWEEVTQYPTGLKTGEVSVSPVFNAEGRCTILAGSVRDVTERKLMEDRLHSSEETFRLLFETSRDGIILMTEQREFVRANHAAAEMFGCADEQHLLAMGPDERCPEFQPNGRRSDEYAREIIAGSGGKGPTYFQWTYRRRDGSEFVAENMVAHLVLDGRNLIHMTVRDITEWIDTQARLSQIGKLYAALSQCNQAIIQCENEAELLDKVCSIAVGFGGLQMAWIGMLEESTNLLRPVAFFGLGTEYLDGIEVSTLARKSTGKGPGGKAFRNRSPVWCQDFMADPSLEAWHERGREFGWRSIAALPLYRKGTVVGVFLVYSGMLDAFDGEVQDLLVEMAEDISFGLGYMQDKHDRDVERNQLRRLSQVVEQSHNMIMITDAEGCVEYINPAFARITGYSLGEIQGQNARILESGTTPPATFTDLWSRLKLNESWQGEIVTRKKDGSEFINLVYVAPFVTDDEKVTHYLSVGEDITEHRHAEWRVEYLANYDELTGLPNRVQLKQRFDYALSVAKRSKGDLTLMFIDLDYFKNINDTLGHSVGDAVLKETARRLLATLKGEDVVCRLGGDEFIVMLSECNADASAKVAGKLLDVISEPCKVGKNEFVIHASLGISVYPQDGSDLETLSKNADMAMYLAKQQGRGCYRFYTAEMQVRTSRSMRLTGEMRHAIHKDQLEIHYQPQISGGRIIGAEALLRWHHPELGAVPPDEFIPAAEESGLILEIGEWVLRTVVRQMKAWVDAGLPPLGVSVNLSPAQFRDAGFYNTVVQVLEEAQLPPELLELEITEGAAMLDPDLAISLTNRLNRLGVRFSIDDFGTGYSSLNYLKKFTIYKLKIDQSFVRELMVDSEDRAIVSTIINMARGLGLIVIAEGVETEDQYRCLSELGCDEMQGYYFSKPLPLPEFEAFRLSWDSSPTPE